MSGTVTLHREFDGREYPLRVEFDIEPEIEATPTQPGYPVNVVIYSATLISGNQKAGFVYVDMLPVMDRGQIAALRSEILAHEKQVADWFKVAA